MPSLRELPPKEWSVPMTLTYRFFVTIIARTPTEAKNAAGNIGTWQDDGMTGAELSDWEVTGEPIDRGEVEP